MYFHGQDLTGKRIRQGCGLKEKRSLEIEPGLVPRGILPEWLAQEWVETQSQPTRRRAGCNLACCEAGRQPGLVSSPLQGQPQHKHTQLWSLYLHCSAQLTSPLRWSLHISVCVSHTHTHTHIHSHTRTYSHTTCLQTRMLKGATSALLNGSIPEWHLTSCYIVTYLIYKVFHYVEALYFRWFCAKLES